MKLRLLITLGWTATLAVLLFTIQPALSASSAETTRTVDEWVPLESTTPTATSTEASTATPTIEPSPTPTPTETASPTPTETATPTPTATPPDPLKEWVNVAPGVDYHEYRLPDPNHAYVARMEITNTAVTIESSIAQGRLSGGTERVTGMAARYDQAINYWGGAWGARNDVVIAINGFYFGEPEEPPGVPWQGQVHSGWYAKQFDYCEGGTGGSGFAWKMDRSHFIGESVWHPADKQAITFLEDGATQQFDGINILLENDELILYTPQYDAHTPITDTNDVVEVLVEMTQPDLLRLQPGVTGTVVEIRDHQSGMDIPFDHVVLTAHGAARTELLMNLDGVGDSIGIAHKIKNCASSEEFDWTDTYASIGGAYYYLKGGVIDDFDEDVRHPRTSIAYNDQYIYFIVVDGRDTLYSRGMTVGELAIFARDTLGATYGIAQDGGGSSTMVVNGEVMNNTVCNNAGYDRKNQVYTCRPVFLPLVVKPGAPPPEPSPPTNPYVDHQRYVANGMLMVAVEPISQTLTYTPTASVVALVEANLRLGPGTNYAVQDTIEAGTVGTVLAHNLNGVLAKGYHWWKVDFGGDKVGWISEDSLGPVE